MRKTGWEQICQGIGFSGLVHLVRVEFWLSYDLRRVKWVKKIVFRVLVANTAEKVAKAHHSRGLEVEAADLKIPKAG